MKILTGNCLDILPTLPDKSIQCCITSPPYFGLRDYQTGAWIGGDPNCAHVSGQRYYTMRGASSGEAFSKAGAAGAQNAARLKKARWRESGRCRCGAEWIDQQLGLEATPESYVANLVQVFREVRRVLRDDGTVWLNLGDSYNTRSVRRADGMRTVVKNLSGEADLPPWRDYAAQGRARYSSNMGNLKDKDLMMIPPRVAIALQDDGWYLRSDIIWHKRNVMPESVKDRPTNCYEHVFLLAKQKRYYYDAEAIRQPPTGRTDPITGFGDVADRRDGGRTYLKDGRKGANARNVWIINPKPFRGAHFATMPTELAEKCIKAGSRIGDTILDPFAGAGTTAFAAASLGRDSVSIELNPDYVAMAQARVGPLAAILLGATPAQAP